jgi:hypothetical protein
MTTNMLLQESEVAAKLSWSAYQDIGLQPLNAKFSQLVSGMV